MRLYFELAFLWMAFCPVLCCQEVDGPPSPLDLDWLRSQVSDGALVHHAAGRLYLTELSSGRSVYIGAGNQPEFSPDSSKLAWIDGDSAKGRMRKGNTTVHLIARNVVAEGGVHWIGNREVALVLEKNGRRAWHRVSLQGRSSEIPELTRLGTGGYECDVRLGEDGVWSYVAKRSWRTSDGRGGRLPGSCSVSISPDGRSATSLHNPHKRADITAIRPGGIQRPLLWKYRGGFDNHRWSSNDPRFIVAVDEHHQTMAVMTADGTRLTRMGTLGKARHMMYGDFTVGDGSGDPWPVADRSSQGSSWPGSRSGLVFLWENGRSSNAVALQDGPPHLCRLLPRGRTRLDRFFAMQLRDGFCITDSESDQLLSDRWKASGQFTLQAVLSPGRETAAEAHILAFEGQPAHGLLLGARNGRLFLRLESSQGSSESELGSLDGKTRQLSVSYTPGQLRALLDGRLSALRHDLSQGLDGWGKGRLQLGGKGGSGWHGALEGLALYDRALGIEEVRHNQRLYSRRLADRRPLPRLKVEGLLLRKRPIPPAEAYPDILVVYDYRVKRVLQGQYEPSKLLAVHWGVLNGRLQEEIRDRQQGQSYFMLMERFSDHPELQRLQIVENFQDTSLPLFYALDHQSH